MIRQTFLGVGLPPRAMQCACGATIAVGAPVFWNGDHWHAAHFCSARCYVKANPLDFGAHVAAAAEQPPADAHATDEGESW